MGSEDAMIRLYDNKESRKFIKTLDGHQESIKSLAFDPLNEYLVSTSQDGTARIWSLATYTCVKHFDAMEQGDIDLL